MPNICLCGYFDKKQSSGNDLIDVFSSSLCIAREFLAPRSCRTSLIQSAMVFCVGPHNVVFLVDCAKPRVECGRLDVLKATAAAK